MSWSSGVITLYFRILTPRPWSSNLFYQYGGKYVINPSGGLEVRHIPAFFPVVRLIPFQAKGHPLGATGLGMHFYVTVQLRGCKHHLMCCPHEI